MKKIVVAALIKKNNKILLSQRKEDDIFALMWEFPGGAKEKNETLKEAIKREIKEELNVSVKPEKIINRFADGDILVYLILCKLEDENFLKKECNDFGFFSYKEAKRLNLAPVDRKILDYIFKKQKI